MEETQSRIICRRRDMHDFTFSSCVSQNGSTVCPLSSFPCFCVGDYSPFSQQLTGMKRSVTADGTQADSLRDECEKESTLKSQKFNRNWKSEVFSDFRSKRSLDVYFSRSHSSGSPLKLPGSQLLNIPFNTFLILYKDFKTEALFEFSAPFLL